MPSAHHTTIPPPRTVDKLEGACGGGAGVEPGLVGDDLRGGSVADAERVVDGGGGEGERV